MRRYPAKRGSALLIVLGMIAFMVVSAVAFSAYMRSSRLPSSYLRRSSASRLLAKAALAEAIEEIDAAIGNNPHPGVGSTKYKFPRTSGDIANRNFWAERVYIGSTNLTSSSVKDNFASPDDTTSVLNLEALAYLPPPLINEVRYYSRRSNAAVWHDMAFDAGRYAFCAVDVSDFFDINVVTAGSGFSGGSAREIPAGRNSSDTGRITLAHSFENSSHNGYAVDPKEWDKFMDKYVNVDGDSANDKVPLISVADMNLAIHSEQPGGMTSPFGEYVENGTPFVQSETGSDAELVRGATFVTDSLFVSTNDAADVFNLANPKDQPFYGFPDVGKEDKNTPLDTLMQKSSDFISEHSTEIPPAELVALHDYVDVDSIPTSLALPTVERTPLITGVAIEHGPVLNTVYEQYEKAVGDGSKSYSVKSWKLHLSGSPHVAVGLAYPFKYSHGNSKRFKVQAAMTISPRVIDGDTTKSYRLGQAKSPAVITKADWPTAARPASLEKFGGSSLPSVVVAFSAPKSITLPDSVKSEKDAVLEDVLLDLGTLNIDLAAEIGDGQTVDKSVSSFRIIQEMKTSDGGGKVAVGEPVLEYGYAPANANLSGAVNPSTWSDGSPLIYPLVNVWVRVLDENDNVVDLVPACREDDAVESKYLSVATSSSRSVLMFAPDDLSLSSSLADSSSAFALNETSMNNLAEQKKVAAWPSAWIADDPRYNYAPENMVAMSSMSGKIGEVWLDGNTSGAVDRDGDIFMSVSDAGYLQSAYEFENLPYIAGMKGKVKGFGDLSSTSYKGTMFNTSFGHSPVKEHMWRTYFNSPYPSNDDWVVDIGDLFFDVESGSKGFRINPYTPSKSVMMAVLANSPLDWWAASTNDTASSVKEKQLTSLAEANKYTYSQHSGAQVQLKHENLEKVADYMIQMFRANPDETWQSVFDGMNWEVGDGDGAFNKLCEQDVGVELHSVDRKFLHGFWRECFATRQQLFLVFVRAEPTMMGSGASGKSAPQLGARAVALVWRDPAPTATDVTGGQPRPHRSRILFYRQFD